MVLNCANALRTGQPRLVKAGQHGRYALSVRFKLRAELFAQQFLFAAHTNDGADEENYYRSQKTEPIADGQARSQQHAEHPRVNWVTHKLVRTPRGELVTF